MSNVMSKAWEIAKAGQKKFGGNVKEYFADALRMAWAQSKSDKVVCIADQDNKQYIIQFVEYGKFVSYTFADMTAFKQKRAHCYYNLGLKLYDLYVIKNGEKQFLRTDVAA